MVAKKKKPAPKKTAAKRYYWAIYTGKKPEFKGTFLQCWNRLVAVHANKTLKKLLAEQVKIGRMN